MEIPYGFDCYTFSKNEVRHFESNIISVRKSYGPDGSMNRKSNVTHFEAKSPIINLANPERDKGNYVMFTRKNEDYTKEQLQALVSAGRLNASENSKDRKIFCGIKIQIGIGVVTNFLQTGLQYKTPIRGRSEFVNGTWTGIVSGLTVDRKSQNSYDIAFGNFLAYDEEFPYMKFGPFFAIESKLVVLTGSSRQIEASSFGTNMDGKVWLTVFVLMLLLSFLAAFRVQWQRTKHQAVEEALEELSRMESRRAKLRASTVNRSGEENDGDGENSVADSGSVRQIDIGSVHSNNNQRHILLVVQDFFFMYFTMLLNKPSLEFDDLIWPKHKPKAGKEREANVEKPTRLHPFVKPAPWLDEKSTHDPGVTPWVRRKRMPNKVQPTRRKRANKRHLPTSIRIVSYLWSAACLVMASIYSGEMLAVILLHADQNIDTISQLVDSDPLIEPVIRQDDFTYNLMLKSLDQNMLLLHNMTKIIPRTEVYSRRFIESVSNRKQALLGDDELIETIYDTYHKYYPLYKSKVTYLQYPISIMYRKEFNTTLERKLRRGIVQIFEMGLIQRWYQAQKDTYIQFYDTYERKNSKDENKMKVVAVDQKYKPLSMHHFESFFKLMLMCKLFAFLVLGMEVIVWKIQTRGEGSSSKESLMGQPS